MPRHLGRGSPSINSDSEQSEDETVERDKAIYHRPHRNDHSTSSFAHSPESRPHRGESRSQPSSSMSTTRVRATARYTLPTSTARHSFGATSPHMTPSRSPRTNNPSLPPSPQPRPRTRPLSPAPLPEPLAPSTLNHPYSVAPNHYPAYDTNRRRIGLDHVSFDKKSPPIKPAPKSYYRPQTHHYRSAEHDTAQKSKPQRKPKPKSGGQSANFKNTFQPEPEQAHSPLTPQEPTRPYHRGEGRRWIYATPGALNPSTFNIEQSETFTSSNFSNEQDQLADSSPSRPPSTDGPPSPVPPPSPPRMPSPTGRPQRSQERVKELIRIYGGSGPPQGMNEIRWLEERERLQEQGILPLTDDETEPVETSFKLRPVSPPRPPTPPSPPPSPRSVRKAQLKAKRAVASSTVGAKSRAQAKSTSTNDRQDSVEAEEMSEEHIRALLNVGPTEDIGLECLVDPPPGERPDYALPTLVKLAIFSSPKKRLTLQEIYQALQDRFEWYKENDAWKVGTPFRPHAPYHSDNTTDLFNDRIRSDIPSPFEAVSEKLRDRSLSLVKVAIGLLT